MRSIWNCLEIILIVAVGTLVALIGATIAAAASFIVFASVLGSYLIRRYEVSNALPSAFISSKATPLDRFSAIAAEAAAALLCITLYPFGYFTRSSLPAHLHPGERPLILCHGYMTNRSSLLWLGWRLKKAGRRNIIIPNFRPASASIEDFAQYLAKLVPIACQRAGVEKADLLGHSMGGLVLRYYIERLGGAPFVHTAVTIGAPHLGTKTAVLGLFRTSLQFCPNAPFIREMEASPPAQNIRMLSIWSEFDNIVLPPQNALLRSPYENVMVKNVGHVALLFSKQVLAHLLLAFTSPDTA
jgi:pimeloyl-ACP methyl ester carboxylesterase